MISTSEGRRVTVRTSLACVSIAIGLNAIGSSPGTYPLGDLLPGPAGSLDMVATGAIDWKGALYFAAQDPALGIELWKTDGTPAGTVLAVDVVPGAGSSSPRVLTPLGNNLYFFGLDATQSGRGLWSTDGTPSGTTLVRMFGDPNYPYESRVLNGVMYFCAESPAEGPELWRSDGTPGGTYLVRDLAPGPSGSVPRSFQQIGNALFFMATTAGHGTEIWISDGTAGGTTSVGPQDVIAINGVVNGLLLFTTGSGQLYRTDGTQSGTFPIAAAYSSVPGVVMNQELYVLGGGLWKSDGSPGGTTLLCSVYCYEPPPVALGSQVLFMGRDVHGDELWASDGSPQGTRLLDDLSPGPGSGCSITSADSFVGTVGGVVYLRGSSVGSSPPNELWVTDGSPSGTVRIASPRYPAYGTAFGPGLFFSASDATTGSEPWFTIGYGCLSISPSSLPAASRGQPYAETLTASGGAAPYSFTIVGGALPPGLTLSAGGVLSGTPTAGGSYRIDVEAADGSPGPCGSRRSYALSVRDGVDIIAGQGPGPSNVNEVRVFDAGGVPTPIDFLAYATGTFGTMVASGNIDGGSTAEIVTGPGPGPVHGPHVRAFGASGSPIAKVSFYAYGTLKYGVMVASGGLDTDTFEEIVTGAGPGPPFGPHVRGWNYDGATLSALAKISFFAYGTLRYGVNTDGADVDGDGYAEILTGSGPAAGFGSTVRGWNFDGTSVTMISKINFNAYYYPWGVVVSRGDVDADGYSEILTAPAARIVYKIPTEVLGFDFDGGPIKPLPGFDLYLPTLEGGRVASGPLVDSDRDALLVACGRDPQAGSFVWGYTYDGAALKRLDAVIEAFGGAMYGAAIAAGALGI
ncbi:MAG: ELWxxDGT repeat protein [Acidobacteriota bacterium]